MKLVLFRSAAGAGISPGLLTERGVVDISAAVKKSYTPQLTMQGIIDDFERLRPALEQFGGEDAAAAPTTKASVRCKTARRSRSKSRISAR